MDKKVASAEGGIMRKLVALLIASVACSMSACASNEENVPEKGGVSIVVDYSPYCEDAEDLTVSREPVVYADSGCQEELELVSSAADGTKINYQFETPHMTQDIYVLPPVVVIPESVERRQRKIQEGIAEPSEDFTIEDISVRPYKSIDHNEPHSEKSEIYVRISAEGRCRPDSMMLTHGASHYQGSQSTTYENHQLIELGCTYEVEGDEDAAREILKDANLEYGRLLRYICIQDAEFYSSDPVEIHVLKEEA